MMLSNLVYPATVRAKLSVESRKAFFAAAADVAGKALGLDRGEVVEALLERERLGSTGFGRGIALPHAKLDGIAGVRGLMFQLQRPIDFNAVDDVPVDLLFVLLSPRDAGADHLKALASVSRLLRDSAIVARLRGANSDEALYAVLVDSETRNAA